MKRSKKPPLGDLRPVQIFPSDDEKAILKLDHIPIGSLKDLSTVIYNASIHINQTRRKHDLEDVAIEESDVRLIRSHIFDANPLLSGTLGLFFPSLGVAAIRFDEGAYENSDSTYADIDLMQAILHELYHKGVHIKNTGNFGICDYSKKLDEGLIESHTREIMESEILPQIYPIEAYQARYDLFMKGPAYVQDGVVLRFEDVMLASPPNRIKYYGYSPELQLVDRIKIITPRVYEQLCEYFWKSQPKLAEQTISNAYGNECAKIMSSTDASVGQIIRELRPIWRPE